MDFKSRFKNPAFIAGLILSVIMPIALYMGMAVEDITTWGALINMIKGAISNPYLLATVVINVYNTLVDYSTPGVKDCKH